MRVEVKGTNVDPETRCAHWHSELDVIALKFGCCEEWYACYDCHRENAGHDAKPWPRRRFNENAVLCGVCDVELTVKEYFDCGFACPSCGAGFNPGCARHYELYFEMG